MSSSSKTKYVVGQRPPLTLSKKARKQLANMKPSAQMAEVSKVVSRLISKSSNGSIVIHIPGTESLKGDDTRPSITAKEAAAISRNHSSVKKFEKSAARTK
jgi:hypothetical protein